MRKEKLNSTELDLSVEDEFNIDECYPYRVCQFVPICLQRDKNLDPESEMEAWKGIPILNSILVRKEEVLHSIYRVGENLIQRGYLKQKELFKIYGCVTSCCDDFLKTRLYKKRGQIIETYLDGYFCGHSLCPICLNYNLYKIKTSIADGLKIYECRSELAFYFLTLCIPDVDFDEVGDIINRLSRCWTKLTKRRDLKQMVGYIRSTAVKPSDNEPGESFYHSRFNVHIHSVIALKVKDVDAGLEDRLKSSWHCITDGTGRLDVRLIEHLPSYIEKEHHYDQYMVDQIVSRSTELNGISRAIFYLLEQNNPYRVGVESDQMKKIVAIRMRYPRKRWNFSRGGLFKRIKIIRFTPHKKRQKYPPHMWTREIKQIEELSGPGAARAAINLEHRTSTYKNTVGEIFYHLRIAS